MAEPIIIDCSTACTVTVVHELSLPPFQLDTAEGAIISGAILGIWAIGWAIRMVIKTLNVDDVSNESEK